MFSSFKPKRHPNRPRFLPRLEELETRALPSTYVSSNWSGYGVETNFNNPANYAVTSVLGSWIVPKITGTNHAYSSSWVGIDGFSSATVEQIGTEQDTTYTSMVDGTPQYYAWYEMYPAYPVMINMAIHPGDKITASVSYSGPANSSAGTFTLSLTDNTTSNSFTLPGQSVPSAQRSSAEWIQEAPSSWFGVLPLANFGTESFSNASVNGTNISSSSLPNASINMIDGSARATTSALNGNGFTVTFSGSTTGGGGHHRHSVATVVESAVSPQSAPPMSSLQTAATVYSVVRPGSPIVVTVAAAPTLQTPTFPGYLTVTQTSPETAGDAPQKNNPQGDGPMNATPNQTDPGRGLIDGPGGIMSRHALDDFFADPANQEQTHFEETPALLESTAPAIDVVTGAGLSVLVLGAYLGNPDKAKETEDTTKRKVRWL